MLDTKVILFLQYFKFTHMKYLYIPLRSPPWDSPAAVCLLQPLSFFFYYYFIVSVYYSVLHTKLSPVCLREFNQSAGKKSVFSHIQTQFY